MKIVIVRHGDPDYSIDGLTPKGEREAILLAERMAKLNVKAFYVSPLGRAKRTAFHTLQKMGREAIECYWLQEFHSRCQKPNTQGDSCYWDWLPSDWTIEPRFYDRNHWWEHDVFAKTNIKAEYDDVVGQFDQLLASHGYEREGNFYRVTRPNDDTIVLFCHFGVECVLLSHLFGVSPMVLWHSTVAAPSSVTTLTTEERVEGIASFRMSAFGDISHLYVADEPPAFAARFCELYTNKNERH